MADYVAVTEAMKIGAKQTSLLREVMKMRAENSSSSHEKSKSADADSKVSTSKN